MKFGKDKKYTKSHNVLSIPIGKDGIGEEGHSIIPKVEIIEDPVANRVMDIVNGSKEEEKPQKKKGWKLYLNTIINLLNNIRKGKRSPKISKPSWIQRQKTKLFKWWTRDTTDDMKDLVNFVGIHGILGAPAIISLLTIFNIDIVMIQVVRNTAWLSVILYILGAGSGYYLFLDVNKALEEIWRKKKR